LSFVKPDRNLCFWPSREPVYLWLGGQKAIVLVIANK
jgi:hypothetical protein